MSRPIRSVPNQPEDKKGLVLDREVVALAFMLLGIIVIVTGAVLLWGVGGGLVAGGICFAAYGVLLGLGD